MLISMFKRVLIITLSGFLFANTVISMAKNGVAKGVEKQQFQPPLKDARKEQFLKGDEERQRNHPAEDFGK